MHVAATVATTRGAAGETIDDIGIPLWLTTPTPLLRRRQTGEIYVFAIRNKMNVSISPRSLT
jgi:hypothetical protein